MRILIGTSQSSLCYRERHMHKRPADEPAAQTLDLNGFLGTAYRRGTSSCQDTRLSGVHQPRRLTHLLVHH